MTRGRKPSLTSTHLDETHRSIDLLPKAHPLEPRRACEKVTKTLFEVVGGLRDREVRRQVTDIERVDWRVLVGNVETGHAAKVGEGSRTDHARNRSSTVEASQRARHE